MESENIEILSNIIKPEIKIEDDYEDEAELVNVEYEIPDNLETIDHTNATLFGVNINGSITQQVDAVLKKLPRVFTCETCLKTFKTPKQLRIHIRVHTNERPYKCTECEKAFKQLGALRDHKVVHSGLKRYFCQVCEGYFTTSSSLKRHLRRVHAEAKSFACSLCGETFFNKNAYTEHKEVHFNDILNTSSKEIQNQAKQGFGYKCSVCNKQFNRYINFFLHLDLHLTAMFPCQFCNQSFTHMKLKRHIANHHPHQVCSICGEDFRDKKVYALHENHHFRVDSSTCDYCRVPFDSESVLSHHMLSQHVNSENAHPCTLCVKVFYVSRHLEKHIEFSHVQCKTCKKMFKDSETMFRHFRNKHSRSYLHCKHCNSYLRSKGRLLLHLNLAHKIIGMFFCKICKKRFLRYRNLYLHMKTHTAKRGKMIQETVVPVYGRA